MMQVPVQLLRTSCLVASILMWTPGILTNTGPQVVVDVDKMSPGKLQHFWTSTGLSPPDPHSMAHKFLLSTEQKLNIALIGALPDNAITHVRIHWLLELVTFRSQEGIAQYNWTHLDSLLDWLHDHQLYPGFELMGNPSQHFSNFENDTQVELWYQLVLDLATRYITRYGADAVSRWRFESWNEPDLKGYNTVNFTLKGYLQYFQASARGLREAVGPHLRFGGPAGLFKKREKHPLCWGLLEHCTHNPCSLDFLSFHKKGNSSGDAILLQGVQLIREIHSQFPALKTVPLANDEADPLVRWSKSEPWRGDVRYGAMVARVVILHHQVMVRQLGLHIEVLSNDNAFLNYHPYYFSQRTLLARFQMNNTNPPHVQFFRKPVYVTMALLSFLGETEVFTTLRRWEARRLSVLSARSSATAEWSAAVLVSFSADTVEDPHSVVNVSLVVRNIPTINGSSPLYTVWLLDNTWTNPSAVWQDAGSPVYPEFQLRRRMRAAEGPSRLVPVRTKPSSGPLRLTLSLSLPSVALLHICAWAHASPGQVTRLEAQNVTHNEVLLLWSSELVKSRCIRTYEVEFLPTGKRKRGRRAQFRRINKEDVIFLSYQYAVQRSPRRPDRARERVRGLYRVRAVDYWGRAGSYSPELRYPG